MALPEKIYRYRSSNNLGRLLGEIAGDHWLAPANLLNDPFDGISSMRSIPVSEVKLGARGPVEIEGAEKWMIACFTTSWDNIPMWAHYSGNGTGVCLRYDTKNLLRPLSFDPLRMSLSKPLISKVDYVDILPEREAPIEEKLFSKSIHWEYEDEWRLAIKRMENSGMSGSTTRLYGAIDQVILGWDCPLEIISPILDRLKALNSEDQNIEGGYIELSKSSRKLELQWPDYWKEVISI